MENTEEQQECKHKCYALLRKGMDDQMLFVVHSESTGNSLFQLPLQSPREAPSSLDQFTYCCYEEHICDYTIANLLLKRLDVLPFNRVLVIMRPSLEVRLVKPFGLRQEEGYMLFHHTGKQFEIMPPQSTERLRGYNADAIFVVERDSFTDYLTEYPQLRDFVTSSLAIAGVYFAHITFYGDRMCSCNSRNAGR